VYNRTTSFPVTLEERLRNAVISNYLIGRRLRKAAQEDHRQAAREERERLASFRESIGDCRHMYTRTRFVETPTCRVCGIDEEHHDYEMQGRPYPPGIPTYAHEAGIYEQHLLTTWKVTRAMAESTIEVAQHMRRVLRQGEW